MCMYFVMLMDASSSTTNYWMSGRLLGLLGVFLMLSINLFTSSSQFLKAAFNAENWIPDLKGIMCLKR